MEDHSRTLGNIHAGAVLGALASPQRQQDEGSQTRTDQQPHQEAEQGDLRRLHGNSVRAAQVATSRTVLASRLGRVTIHRGGTVR